MNYRHAFHAGNFADVLKHVVLARILEHLKRKPAPFRAIDLHAGVGLYDLAGEAAAKTGEWEAGIGKLYTPTSSALPLSAEAEALLMPWRKAVSAVNDGTRLVHYPGSPEIIRRLAREADRMTFNELHPEDHSTLARRFANESRAIITELDAWTALKAALPPPERRGLVLIDPPYEVQSESEQALAGLKEAHRRFATGTILLWYPIKGQADANAFARRAAALAIPKMMRVELNVRRADDRARLNGSGLILINPTWPLEDEIAGLLPELTSRLADPAGRYRGGWRADWLVDESGKRILD